MASVMACDLEPGPGPAPIYNQKVSTMRIATTMITTLQAAMHSTITSYSVDLQRKPTITAITSCNAIYNHKLQRRYTMKSYNYSHFHNNNVAGCAQLSYNVK